MGGLPLGILLYDSIMDVKTVPPEKKHEFIFLMALSALLMLGFIFVVIPLWLGLTIMVMLPVRLTLCGSKWYLYLMGWYRDHWYEQLPRLEQGEEVDTLEVASDRKETKPPRRYSDASLLAAMETAGKLVEDEELREAMKDSGIGTPATRAAIIERLIDVGYVERDGRSLVCTEKGLNVIRLRLPPLRERREDIPALANHFLAASARALGVPAKRLTPDALAALVRFDFPGNVRQLENFCHWLTVMASGQTIDRDDLPPEVRAAEQSAPAPGRKDEPAPADWQEGLLRDAQNRLARGEPNIMATLTRQFERILLQTALDACRGRRVEAASRLGIGRNTITRKLRELGMEDE